MICPACRQENPDGFRFCGACGASLETAAAPEREERKVVSVLFADLVGFTSRAERLDPEDVRAVLAGYHERLRSELERHGGTVEKFIGDAVMALFGAPVAREDDAERAVRAALAIRDAIGDSSGDLHVRIGVTTGEALIRLGARPEIGEGMAAGDVVNTAARLQSAAPVDGILVDERTFRATERQIAYAEADSVDAKGKAEPIAVWTALEARARFGTDVAQAARGPLVGRVQEIDALADALARVRRDRAPQLVTLIGVPGIGKSRLVYELFRLVEADPELIVWRQGRCLQYGEGASYRALGDVVKAQAGILETDDDASALAKLRRAVTGLLPEAAEAGWVERHLRPLIGLAGESSSDGGHEEAHAAWRRFVEALADEGPAVVTLEDVHWADDGLLDFVEHLLDWASGVPLLVLCIARPELLSRRPGWGGGKANATTLSLAPLADEEIARLIGLLLGRGVMAADLQATLLARAGGNPLYAEEFVHMAGESGQGLDALELPHSVQAIIAARLDALDATDKTLLQQAAVIGKVFWLGAVTFLAGAERLEAERRLHELERRQIVRRDRRSSVAGEVEYSFWHALVRDVAYGQLPRGERARAHRLAAEWISGLAAERLADRADLLAHHYAAAVEFARAAGEDVAELAAPTRAALRAAGERAMSLKSYQAAAEYLRRALAFCPEDAAERPRLLLEAGRAALRAEDRGGEELTAALDELLAAGDVEGAAEAESLLGEHLWMRGRTHEALAHVLRAATLVEALPASAASAYVLGNAARYQMIAGQLSVAIESGRRVLALARELALEELEASTLNNIGTARANSGDPAGLDDLRRSLEISERLGSSESIRGYINLASTVVDLGDLREGKVLHERGYEVARQFGQIRGIRFLSAELATDYYYAGLWDESLRRAGGLIAEFESGLAHYFEQGMRILRAAIGLARGGNGDWVSELTVAVDRSRERADLQATLPALSYGAFLLADTGDRAAADALLDEIVRWAASAEGLAGSPWLYPGAIAFDELGRLDELAALVTVRSRWSDALLVQAAGDRSGAADVLAEIGSLPDEARMRLAAAEGLFADGRTEQAGAQLERAIAFYRTVGATAYLRRAEALMPASA